MGKLSHLILILDHEIGRPPNDLVFQWSSCIEIVDCNRKVLSPAIENSFGKNIECSMHKDLVSLISYFSYFVR